MVKRITILLALALLPAVADDTKKPYGFRGFEIYKLDLGISNLTVCDVDGDKLRDLLVINNRRAKIEVLLRRKDPVPPKTKTGKKLPNDLVDDRFFVRKEILTEKQVASLVAADLNGDGKLDVAYYGKPAELIVAYGDGTGGFPKTARIEIDDYFASSNGLAQGDLNGDGRTDLALIAKGYTAIYHQTKKRVFAEPKKIPHAVKGVNSVGIDDLNGDGRMDLLHFVPASPRSLRVRFGGPGGLGAEIAYETSAWRNLDIADIGPDKGAEILVVQRSSGVLRALKATSAPNDGVVSLGSLEVHAFEPSRGKKARSMAIGDLNGDKRLDIVVTEPGTAQVAVYIQGGNGRLQGPAMFPSLSEVSALRLADLNGDGRAEVIVLSQSERAVGVTQLKDGRLAFPNLMPLGGVPKAMDTGDTDGDGKPDLVVVVQKDKSRFAQTFPGGQGAGQMRPLKDLRGGPDDLMIMDLDQDGVADLLLFDRFEALHVFPGKGDPYKADSIQKLTRGNVAVADVDGDGKPELWTTNRNFARAVMRDAKRGIRIKDQANGRSPSSQIKGVAMLGNELALFDRDKAAVSILKRGEGGVFEVIANLSVGTLEYQRMFVADLNGDGRKDIAVFGKNRFGVMYAGGRKHELAGQHSIESTLRDARLEGFAVGDLNGDAQPDIAVLDSGNHGVQIFSYDAKAGFKERLHWPIYQKKMHENPRRGGGAREIVVADFDGDGLNDIAVIVHDRVIVYPQ